eukprot:6174049-Pleurochrysis_carterae.AAC.3
MDCTGATVGFSRLFRQNGMLRAFVQHRRGSSAQRRRSRSLHGSDVHFCGSTSPPTLQAPTCCATRAPST